MGAGRSYREGGHSRQCHQGDSRRQLCCYTYLFKCRSSSVTMPRLCIYCYHFLQSFTQALYMLAAHPECVAPLREEAESIIKEDGWTRTALQKLRKVDSFMRENQRINGITSRKYLLMSFAHLTPGIFAEISSCLCESHSPEFHTF